MDDAAVDHIGESGVYVRDHLGFIKYDGFDETLDSNGTAWPETLSFRAQQGKSYLQVLGDLSTLGYEWDVAWNDGAGMYELSLFVPYNPVTLGGGLGSDLTASGVAVTWGAGVTGGPLIRSAPSGNAAISRGAEGLLGFSTDATSIANFGRREIAELDDNLLSPTTVQSLADQILIERLSATTGQQTTVEGDVADRPLRDFDAGDRIATQSQFGLVDRRIRKIESSLSEEHTSFSLDFDRQTFGGGSGGAEAIRRLLLKFDGLDDIAPADNLAADAEPFRGPIEVTFLVASSTARSELKAVADYVCSGVDDHLEIQTALDSLPTGGGRVMLSEGFFDIVSEGGAGTAALGMPTHSTLEGVGAATVLSCYGDNSTIEQIGIDMGQDCTVSNLEIDLGQNDDDKFVGIYTSSSRCLIENVNSNQNPKGNAVTFARIAFGGIMQNCILWGISSWGPELYEGTIEGCFFSGVGMIWCPPTSDNVHIVGNRFAGRTAIKLELGTRATIVGNHFPDQTDFANQTIWIVDWDKATISGNYFGNQVTGS